MSRQHQCRLTSWAWRVLVGAEVLLLSIWGALALAIGETDSAELRAFLLAVERWQENPDFREVTAEYVVLGSHAVHGRVAGLPGDTAVMIFRGLPGLPDWLAASPGSDLHYQDFSQGALSAYLRLLGEQDLVETIPMIEDLGHQPNATDDQIREFLRSFKLRDNTVAMDDGAVRSVRRLLTEIEASKPLVIREDPRPLFEPSIASVARSLGAPPEPIQMSPLQQQRVYLELDDEIRSQNRELWRTKQVDDLLCGIWGQAYGQSYTAVIRPVLVIREWARETLPLPILLLTATVVLRRPENPRSRTSPKRLDVTRPAAAHAA